MDSFPAGHRVCEGGRHKRKDRHAADPRRPGRPLLRLLACSGTATRRIDDARAKAYAMSSASKCCVRLYTYAMSPYAAKGHCSSFEITLSSALVTHVERMASTSGAASGAA